MGRIIILKRGPSRDVVTLSRPYTLVGDREDLLDLAADIMEFFGVAGARCYEPAHGRAEIDLYPAKPPGDQSRDPGHTGPHSQPIEWPAGETTRDRFIAAQRSRTVDIRRSVGSSVTFDADPVPADNLDGYGIQMLGPTVSEALDFTEQSLRLRDAQLKESGHSFGAGGACVYCGATIAEFDAGERRFCAGPVQVDVAAAQPVETLNEWENALLIGLTGSIGEIFPIQLTGDQCSRSQFGIDYVTLVNGFMVPDGEKADLTPSLAQAIGNTLDYLREKRADGHNLLVWRKHPTIISSARGAKTALRMRLHTMQNDSLVAEFQRLVPRDTTAEDVNIGQAIAAGQRAKG